MIMISFWSASASLDRAECVRHVPRSIPYALCGIKASRHQGIKALTQSAATLASGSPPGRALLLLLLLIAMRRVVDGFWLPASKGPYPPLQMQFAVDVERWE